MGKKIVALLLSAIAAFGLVCCGTGGGDYSDITYPDFPRTPDDKNSWEYAGGEQLRIDWYVNVSSWRYSSNGNDRLSEIIKEKTGISVTFQTPVDESGQLLSTILASNDLPDVMTLTTDSPEIDQMAAQGYVYDINGLAERWAPSLKNNLRSDVWSYYADDAGKIYGIPNHYYSYQDVPADTKLQPNGCMMVRKDWLEWYQTQAAAMADGEGFIALENGTKVPAEGYITTQEGFIDACKKVKEHFGSTVENGVVPVQLANFTSNGNVSLTWLAEYFAVPYEDENGDYAEPFTQEGYVEVLRFLNTLYNDGLITDANFTQNAEAVGNSITNGRAFVSLLTPQNYPDNFETARRKGAEYVPLYITNRAGDAPVLRDIRGYGYMYSMITKNCARPDLVIKLFDFLCSDEGQRLVYYGPEGETWEWYDDAHTEIRYTDTFLQEKELSQIGKYGLKGFDLFINWQYCDNLLPKATAHAKTEKELFLDNMKRPMSVYTADYNGAGYKINANDKDYKTYNTNASRVTATISTQLPIIIKAKNWEAAKAEYDRTITRIGQLGFDTVLAKRKEGHRRIQKSLGIEGASWPGYDPSYTVKPDRTKPTGDDSYKRNY